MESLMVKAIVIMGSEEPKVCLTVNAADVFFNVRRDRVDDGGARVALYRDGEFCTIMYVRHSIG